MNSVAPRGPFYWMKIKVCGSEWAKGTRSEQNLDSGFRLEETIETIKTITLSLFLFSLLVYSVLLDSSYE